MHRWRTRFFTIWTGQALSLLGSGLVQFALVWWLTTTTGSATVLATATMAALLPAVLLAPFAGVLADRWNRRLILIASDGLVALTTLALLLVYLSGGLEVWHVYLAAVLRAAAGAFHFPTMMASTTQLVPPEHLTRVSGLDQTIEGVTQIAAPALGALLLAVADLRVVLLVDILTAAAAILPLLFFAIPQPALTPEQRAQTSGLWVLHDFAAGFRTMVTRRGLILIAALVTGINLLLTPAFTLMPLLIRNEFGRGAAAYAAVETTFGLGAIVGGLALAAWGGFRSKIVTSLSGLIGLGIGVLMIAVAPANAFWLLVAAMALLGIMHSFTNGPLRATVQAVVEPGMQARVFSLLSSMAMGTTPIGLLVAGPVADRFGIRVWFLAGALFSLLMGVVGFFLPALRTLEASAAPAVAAESQPASQLLPAD